MPSGRVLALPGVSEASGVDVSIRGLSLYVSDGREGSVHVLKLSSSRSRQGLTPVGRVLRVEVRSLWLSGGFVGAAPHSSSAVPGRRGHGAGSRLGDL